METRWAEIRQSSDRRVVGEAVRYDDVATISGLRERFAPRAFGDLAHLDVILNVQHDRLRPIARTGGGGLTLRDDDDALRFSAIIPPTRDGDDALTLVRRGVLRGASVEFRADAERYDADLRVIERATLGGIALCDRPAYPESLIEARRERKVVWRAGWPYEDIPTADGKSRQVKLRVGRRELEYSYPDAAAKEAGTARKPWFLSMNGNPIATTDAGLDVSLGTSSVAFSLTASVAQTTTLADMLKLWAARALVLQPVLSVAPTEVGRAEIVEREPDGTPIVVAPIVVHGWRLLAGSSAGARITGVSRLAGVRSENRRRLWL